MYPNFNEQEQCIRAVAEKTDNSMPIDEVILVRLMLHFNQLYMNHRNQLLKKHALNETQFIALVLIYFQPSHQLQPSKLSEMLGSSKTNITRVSDELERKGWVERQKIETDRRAYLLKVTATGEEFIKQFLPTQWQLIKDVFSVVSPEEWANFMRILKKVVSHLEDTNNYSNS